ncbi:MAG TPA: prephenate dehydrogenase [Trebonia sp.]|nr:prephenate dehydrogenase [Trebonia sp.]
MVTPPAPARVLVIGTGLIGTSVALALRERGTDVWLSDLDADAARLAAGLGAGTMVPDLGDAKGIADIAVLAMPPEEVAAMLGLAQDFGVARWYTDVASVKSLPVSQARSLGCDLESFVPGHPLAGRERHGPGAARADLFLGRTWALCPLPETSPEAVRAAADLAAACGADVVRTDAATHDQWVALVSHAPHLVAAAMAARLAPASVSDSALRLAGQGLRDTTRIAAGDPALWTQILSANALPVAEVIAAVAEDLTAAARSLTEAPGAAHALYASPAGVDISDISGYVDVLERGRAGVARIPGKRGGEARAFAVVQVVISDTPGELARLFSVAGEAGVNVEDVRIEHSPGHPTGVIEISVRPDQAATLLAAVTAGGWSARG